MIQGVPRELLLEYVEAMRHHRKVMEVYLSAHSRMLSRTPDTDLQEELAEAMAESLPHIEALERLLGVSADMMERIVAEELVGLNVFAP
ncbi:MAG: hypothetical protein AAGJ40_09095 [Planctomycetota bacterium]